VTGLARAYYRTNNMADVRNYEVGAILAVFPKSSNRSG
jgi:hypothetical protein